jgi:hypothetical protein
MRAAIVLLFSVAACGGQISESTTVEGDLTLLTGHCVCKSGNSTFNFTCPNLWLVPPLPPNSLKNQVSYSSTRDTGKEATKASCTASFNPYPHALDSTCNPLALDATARCAALCAATADDAPDPTQCKTLLEESGCEYQYVDTMTAFCSLK